ncbi:alpha-L-glutamate ligase [Helicobacter saguini]|uniref:Alpha-L-glutamate ligase n=1 Tax=Helicobacter saguini TaxID=1548018 RepID=A0A347VNW6_9HELI|nr:hypothetical protein [Helicobacter saguini]MWV61609.1 alpha-L-glutamate ligase [Helicobacter saguini]MWV67719.1 alpha-L-glutamate ligase [Helicobacter saguini]MWV70071.1 alpha-L-glutamate ligase [Helicobacter saguini]MWV72716.1 alpha-L-glutamate ligase [Helicobacter saguini]TLD92020.1 alpha-L-glutamate ligase [Helicobacter saguini]
MLLNDLKKGIYIIHENSEWIPPFRDAFNRAKERGTIKENVELNEIVITNGAINLANFGNLQINFKLDSKKNKKTKERLKDSTNFGGVFWSRLSASCHTRGNMYSKEYGRALLNYLEYLESFQKLDSKKHNKIPIKVINSSAVLEYEVSKVRQYLALQKAGFRVPKTIAVFGKSDLLECAKKMQTPFITKHNQGGKGLGVRLFESISEFQKYIESSEFEMPNDGITLLQEYIRTKEFFITRIEFVNSKFVYAVRVDTSGGSFELCPADACNIDSKKPEIAGAACAVGSDNKFKIRPDITKNTPLVKALESFLKEHRIYIAGIEFMESVNGEIVVYDINTNTNYNSAVESSLRNDGKLGAADKVIKFLYKQYEKL